MKRRKFLRILGVAPPLAFLGAFPGATGVGAGRARGGPSRAQEFEPLEKTQKEWREILSPEAYAVLRKDDTERAFTSPLNDEKRSGTFICAGCFLPLFSSTTKFDSGTGWPSFTSALEGRVGTKRDFKLIWPRTEYHCGRCGGHQGHIFKDGPEPTGQRWCNNGVALVFVKDGEELPELRT